MHEVGHQQKRVRYSASARRSVSPPAGSPSACSGRSMQPPRAAQRTAETAKGQFRTLDVFRPSRTMRSPWRCGGDPMELVKNAWRLVAPVQRESVHVNIDVTYLNAVIAARASVHSIRPRTDIASRMTLPVSDKTTRHSSSLRNCGVVTPMAT